MIVWYDEQEKSAVADIVKDFTLREMYSLTQNGEECGLIIADGVVSGVERWEE